MCTPPAADWLSSEEESTWRAVWAVMTWLPARLDAQLRTDAGMSLAEYSALSQISEAPERTMRLSELGLVANMNLSHLSRVLSRLEKVGWVERFPDPADGRFTLGRLTEEGWRQVEAAAPGHVAAVRRYVFDALTPQQVEDLGGAAGVVARVVKAPGGGGADGRSAESRSAEGRRSTR